MFEHLPANIRRGRIHFPRGIEIDRPRMIAIFNPGPQGGLGAPTQT